MQKGEIIMILACHHISKSFGTDVILDDISFHIEEYEKAAIVGINGAGKSTLLKIIMEELSADSGEVILAKGKTIGYLAQHHSRDSQRTIYEELLDVKKEVLSVEKEPSGNFLVRISGYPYNAFQQYFDLKSFFANENNIFSSSVVT